MFATLTDSVDAIKSPLAEWGESEQNLLRMLRNPQSFKGNPLAVGIFEALMGSTDGNLSTLLVLVEMAVYVLRVQMCSHIILHQIAPCLVAICPPGSSLAILKHMNIFRTWAGTFAGLA